MPFSFLNIAFLAGIAAAAVPILIHLFSRRKVARIPFSSIRFLEEIARRRVRRIRLTQWIILALRVLALALLAFALGRPALRGDFAFGKTRGESAVAVILDRSFSMQAEGVQETLWEKALARVEEALLVLEPEDTVFLLGAGSSGQTETLPGRLAFGQAVRDLEVGFSTTDLPGAVRRAASVLAGATALNKELFIISDFQQSGMLLESEGAFPDLTGDLDPEVRVFLIPVDEGPLGNTALVEARLEGSIVDRRVHIQAVHHSDSVLDEVAVTVESGPETLGEAAMTLLARNQETVEISLTRLPGEGEEIRARLSRDRLAADDIRYIPTVGGGGISTWIVQDPSQPSLFLPLALSPDENTGQFEVRQVAPEVLITANLGDVRLIVLDNVTFLSREAVNRLRQWRSGGGALFISLGDRVDLRFYNDTILPALFPGVSLGNLLGVDEATGSSYTLTPRTPGHVAFSGFDAKVGEPLTGASFWRIVEVRNEPGVHTVATFGPGLPALVQGDGALLFASSLDGKWNNMPTHAAFLPLLHQSLDAMLLEGSEDRVRVGERVEGLVDRFRVPTGADLVCLGPGGLKLNVTANPVPRGLQLKSDPAPLPGFYTIQAGGRTLVQRAVNVDARTESDLTPLTRDEMLQVFPGDRVRIIEAGVSLGTPVREARYGREIWRELVAVVMLLLIIEGWLSRRGVN